MTKCIVKCVDVDFLLFNLSKKSKKLFALSFSLCFIWLGSISYNYMIKINKRVMLKVLQLLYYKKSILNIHLICYLFFQEKLICCLSGINYIFVISVWHFIIIFFVISNISICKNITYILQTNMLLITIINSNTYLLLCWSSTNHNHFHINL